MSDTIPIMDQAATIKYLKSCNWSIYPDRLDPNYFWGRNQDYINNRAVGSLELITAVNEELQAKKIKQKFQNDLEVLLNEGEKKKMAKFKTVGSICKKKAPKKGKYIKFTETVTISGSKETPFYLQVYDIKQREGESDEKFAERKSWILGDVVLVSDDS